MYRVAVPGVWLFSEIAIPLIHGVSDGSLVREEGFPTLQVTGDVDIEVVEIRQGSMRTCFG